MPGVLPRTGLTLGLVLIAIATAHSSHALVNATLRWTAPGDDGVIGTATLYDIRYAYQPLTPINFNSAVGVVGVPLPRPAGTRESFVIRGLPDQTTVYIALRARDEAGNWSGISNIAVFAASALDIPAMPTEVAFGSAVPNPARGQTRFRLALPQPGRVQVEVLDLSGRRVRSLADAEYAAGSWDVAWDLRDGRGSPVEAGMYLVRADLPGGAWTRRVAVLR